MAISEPPSLAHSATPNKKSISSNLPLAPPLSQLLYQHRKIDSLTSKNKKTMKKIENKIASKRAKSQEKLGAFRA